MSSSSSKAERDLRRLPMLAFLLSLWMKTERERINAKFKCGIDGQYKDEDG